MHVQRARVVNGARVRVVAAASTSQMASTHQAADIGVFFCGPKVMSRALHKTCNMCTSTRRGGTKFFYHKENF